VKTVSGVGRGPLQKPVPGIAAGFEQRARHGHGWSSCRRTTPYRPAAAACQEAQVTVCRCCRVRAAARPGYAWPQFGVRFPRSLPHSEHRLAKTGWGILPPVELKITALAGPTEKYRFPRIEIGPARLPPMMWSPLPCRLAGPTEKCRFPPLRSPRLHRKHFPRGSLRICPSFDPGASLREIWLTARGLAAGSTFGGLGNRNGPTVEPSQKQWPCTVRHTGMTSKKCVRRRGVQGPAKYPDARRQR
jgi:hypothetical protein